VLQLSIALGPQIPRPPASGGQHAHGGVPGTETAVSCAICPAARDGSGTSWQPDDSTGTHHHWRSLGTWQLAAHLQAAVTTVDEGGPRGDAATSSVNHGTVALRRPLKGGTFGVQSMWSLEPAMGRRGYPLLLQTGETADGVTALVDRQHPHDLPMELAATYSRAIGADRAVSLYAAAVGAPAIGPPPFMHRASGALLPVSPITHHWFDSTHITFGVVTAGFVLTPRAKIEASVFRGREPDQHRWGFERPGLDSSAFRLSVNPSRHLALQVSAANIVDAERLHPRADVARLTASAMYAGQLAGNQLDATIAWGRNNRSPSSIPVPGGVYFYAGSVTQALLAEGTLQRGRHAVVTRIERAEKDELFPLADPRHTTIFPVTRVTLGYAFRVGRTQNLEAQVGGAAAWSAVDGALESDYGRDPRSGLFFLRIGVR
jgi:hypothetical protein